MTKHVMFDVEDHFMMPRTRTRRHHHDGDTITITEEEMSTTTNTGSYYDDYIDDQESFSSETKSETTTPLFEAIEDGNYEAVERFLRTGQFRLHFNYFPFNLFFHQGVHPMGSPRQQASTWVTRLISRQLPLHLAMRHNAPLSLVDSLIQAYPKALQCRDTYGNLPLHIAILSNCRHSVIKLLILEFPKALHIENESGMTPLKCYELIEDMEPKNHWQVIQKYVGCVQSINQKEASPIKNKIQKIGNRMEIAKSQIRLVQLELQLEKDMQVQKENDKIKEDQLMKLEVERMKNELIALRSEKERLSKEKELLQEQIDDDDNNNNQRDSPTTTGSVVVEVDSPKTPPKHVDVVVTTSTSSHIVKVPIVKTEHQQKSHSQRSMDGNDIVLQQEETKQDQKETRIEEIKAHSCEETKEEKPDPNSPNLQGGTMDREETKKNDSFGYEKGKKEDLLREAHNKFTVMSLDVSDNDERDEISYPRHSEIRTKEIPGDPPHSVNRTNEIRGDPPAEYSEDHYENEDDHNEKNLVGEKGRRKETIDELLRMVRSDSPKVVEEENEKEISNENNEEYNYTPSYQYEPQVSRDDLEEKSEMSNGNKEDYNYTSGYQHDLQARRDDLEEVREISNEKEEEYKYTPRYEHKEPSVPRNGLEKEIYDFEVRTGLDNGSLHFHNEFQRTHYDFTLSCSPSYEKISRRGGY